MMILEKIMTFAKQRRAKTTDDFETWIESNVANTMNNFDMGDTRATTVIVDGEEDNTDGEKVF